MPSTFYTLYRKQGFSLTLEILNDFEKNEAKESEFFEKLKENNSYLNEFYRVKKSLLQYGLVQYKLDVDYDKVLVLTDKGRDLLQKLQGIENLVVS